jgi:cold shock CspA family protein
MNKKESEQKKKTKKEEKQKRIDNRKLNSGGKSFDDMIAYVDKNGLITDTPPDLSDAEDVELENILISTPQKEYVEILPLTGQVEHFNNEKAYGFIKDSNSNETYFFHINNAPAQIAEGNLVTYELERGKKGMNAVNITIIKNIINK